MTIAIVVKVGEGLVLGADSAVSLPAPTGQIAHIFNYGRKLYKVLNYPIGIVTWGLGMIENRNVESLIKEFENTGQIIAQRENWKVKDIANLLFAFMQNKYNASSSLKQMNLSPQLGMMIAGYSSNTFFPEVYEIVIPSYTSTKELFPNQNGKPQFGGLWRGMTDALIRLLRGGDDKLLNQIKQSDPNFQGIPYQIPFDLMPLQDAVDFTIWCLNVTLGRWRFVVGPPLCGGEIDVAAITHDGGFIWLKEKKLHA